MSKKPVSKGTVTEILPSGRCRVLLDDSQKEILAYTAGKLRLHKISIIVGDVVEVEVDPYGGNDTSRIVYRDKHR